jgi:hypothetical protein
MIPPRDSGKEPDDDDDAPARFYHLFQPFTYRDEERWERGGPSAPPASLGTLAADHAYWREYRDYWAAYSHDEAVKRLDVDLPHPLAAALDAVPRDAARVQDQDQDRGQVLRMRTLEGLPLDMPHPRRAAMPHPRRTAMPPVTALPFRDRADAAHHLRYMQAQQRAVWRDGTTGVEWDTVPALYDVGRAPRSGLYYLLVEHVRTLDFVLRRSRRTLAAADLFRLLHLPVCALVAGAVDPVTDTLERDVLCAWRAVSGVPQRQWYLVPSTLGRAGPVPGQDRAYVLRTPAIMAAAGAKPMQTNKWTRLGARSLADESTMLAHLAHRAIWLLQASLLLHPRLAGLRVSPTGRATWCALRLTANPALAVELKRLGLTPWVALPTERRASHTRSKGRAKGRAKQEPAVDSVRAPIPFPFHLFGVAQQVVDESGRATLVAAATLAEYRAWVRASWPRECWRKQ